MASVSKIFRYAAFIAITIALINMWLKNKSYMVQYGDVERIALKNIKPGLKPEQIFANVERELRLKYQGRIIPKKDTQWIFINSGGWMGSMYILHASLTEYILFFGTAIDTSGHSGRYWANVTDTIISGTFRQWPEGQLESRLYKPGDTIVHTWGEVTAVQWTAGTYMVEYGRGFIPSTLTFALADTIFGTTDFVTMFYTFRIYSKALLNEALFLQQDLWQMINTF